MSVFEHDGLNLSYRESGGGVPFIFQHGLGGDSEQTFSLFDPPAGFRMVTLECRAHGQSPVGPEDKISLATFAADLLALMDFLKIDKAVVGGISMGAAIAMQLAVQCPKRVLGLVLDRPAWLDQPRDNIAVFAVIARLIREHGAARGLGLFEESDLYRKTLAQSPGEAYALSAHFLRPRAEEAVARLERIPVDHPGFTREQWRALKVPALVLANDHDAVHPLSFGLTFGREIPGAEFHQLTPKLIDPKRHQREVQRFLEDFLLRHFKNSS